MYYPRITRQWPHQFREIVFGEILKGAFSVNYQSLSRSVSEFSVESFTPKKPDNFDQNPGECLKINLS